MIPENPLKPWRIKNDGFYQTKPTCILHLVISQNISPNADFPFKKSHPIQILTRFGSGVLGMGAENPPIHGLHFQVSTIMFTSSAFMPVQGEWGCSWGAGRISRETLGKVGEDFWGITSPSFKNTN